MPTSAVKITVERIQILDAPMAAPGHCALCGSSVGRMVDFGMNVEFYGVVYFCVDNCLVQIALAFDYHSPKQWKMMMAQVNDQRAEINQLRDQNERLHLSIVNLTNISDIDRTPELDVDKVLEITEPESQSDSEQLSFDFTGGEKRTPEQDTKSRPANVRDDAGDDLVQQLLRDL